MFARNSRLVHGLWKLLRKMETRDWMLEEENLTKQTVDDKLPASYFSYPY
jgi:hypothetical protein